MKKIVIRKAWSIVVVLIFSIKSQAQNSINWTASQLMKPSDLSGSITTQKDLPLIISVGPGAVIPNSIDAGMTSKTEGPEKLKAQLKRINKDRKIVIYCGCCPFEHCPNVRPAIDVLKEMKFTNYYLLDLPHNIKVDWIDKGYPVRK
jgi:thiosulfate/3-mercaptopyruvate sulfurtransferase